MEFKVYDVYENDVTNEKEWFMGTDEGLYYMINDVDSSLVEETKCWIGEFLDRRQA